MTTISNNVFPSLPIDNLGYSFSANAILFSKGPMVNAIFSLPSNISNCIFSQFCIACINSYCCNIQLIFKSVMAILLGCHPFQIASKIIGLITVYMIDLRVVFGVINKGHSHKPMNEKFSLFAILTKKYIFIPLLSFVLPHHSTFNMPRCFPSTFAGPLKRLDSAPIGNFILGFVTTNWKPSFNSHNLISFLVPINAIHNRISKGIK